MDIIISYRQTVSLWIGDIPLIYISYYLYNLYLIIIFVLHDYMIFLYKTLLIVVEFCENLLKWRTVLM